MYDYCGKIAFLLSNGMYNFVFSGRFVNFLYFFLEIDPFYFSCNVNECVETVVAGRLEHEHVSAICTHVQIPQTTDIT